MQLSQLVCMRICFERRLGSWPPQMKKNNESKNVCGAVCVSEVFPDVNMDSRQDMVL